MRDDVVEEDIFEETYWKTYGGSEDDDSEERRVDDCDYEADESDGGEQDNDVADVAAQKNVAEEVVEKEVVANVNVAGHENENILTKAIATDAIGTKPQTEVMVDEGGETYESVLTYEHV